MLMNMNFEQGSEGQVTQSKCFRASCTNQFQFEQGSPYGHYCSESCMLQAEQAFVTKGTNLAWMPDVTSSDEFRHPVWQADKDVKAPEQQA